MLPIALTIAGSDPSGGAGIQADLKTFHQFHVYGQAVLTLLTVQNTQQVSRVELMPPDLIAQQIEAILADMPPHAAKTGALGGPAAVECIAALARTWTFPLVVDPVMISKHGAPLMSDDAGALLRHQLLPHAALLTPNLPEASALTSRPVNSLADMRDAARALTDLGAKAVLVKGGHLTGDAIDILLADGVYTEYPGERINTPHTHGTGCTYSAAITAGLARQLSLRDAVAGAKAFVTAAIRTNPGLGQGHGPVNHFAQPDQTMRVGAAGEAAASVSTVEWS